MRKLNFNDFNKFDKYSSKDVLDKQDQARKEKVIKFIYIFLKATYLSIGWDRRNDYTVWKIYQIEKLVQYLNMSHVINKHIPFIYQN